MKKKICDFKFLKNVIIYLLLLIFFIAVINVNDVYAVSDRAGDTPSTDQTTVSSEEQSTESVTVQPSTEVTTEVKKPKTPAKPTRLKAKYNEKKYIKLTWKKVKKASYYKIYRKTEKGKYKKIGKTRFSSYKDKKIKKDKYYTYKVVAVSKLNGFEAESKKSTGCKVFSSTVDPTKKMVAITFDDGPGPYTKTILKCLKKNNSRATFFVVGMNVDNYKSTLKYADKIGCEIGNHSWDHPFLPSLTDDEISAQIDSTDAHIKNILGKKPKLMRTPYGGEGARTLAAAGKPNILWNIDTMDWDTLSADKTYSCVMNEVSDGDIVLMHDIHGSTKDAALRIIPALRKKGYQLVTVSELAKYRGYKIEKNHSYRSFHKKHK